MRALKLGIQIFLPIGRLKNVVADPNDTAELERLDLTCEMVGCINWRSIVCTLDFLHIVTASKMRLRSLSCSCLLLVLMLIL